MSFRLRIYAMVVLVVLVATAVTAWLSHNQATTQLRESVAAGRAEVTAITTTLGSFGSTRGGWDGVGGTVTALAERTGQRIRVIDDAGTLLADSDILAGRPARQVVGPPVLVDPRAVLRLPDHQSPAVLPRLTIYALTRYRSAVAYARCLGQAEIDASVRTDAEGIPVVTPATNRATTCQPAPPANADVQADSAAAVRCFGTDPLPPCLQRVFTEQIDGFAPRRVQVYLGAVDQSPAPTLALTPVVAVALAVAAAAILGGVLLSRAVLRPVRALTNAARRLGAGDLRQRVPVSGRDEIAELGRSFNVMADQVQAGEERQRRLVADIAHELRTPLANLRGYLEAIRDGLVEPNQQLIGSLHEEVLLQQRIVEDLQDLSMAEAGTLTYHRGRVDIAELLNTCRTAQLAFAGRSGITLTADIAGAPEVYGDPDRLRQVIGNLIVNAVRATPPGGTVRLGARSENGVVRIEISDTGIGIPADELPHVFDRFWRSDPARGRSTGGSGLGLTIVRQLVNDHSGQIEVTSEVDFGTTFTIILPAI